MHVDGGGGAEQRLHTRRRFRKQRAATSIDWRRSCSDGDGRGPSSVSGHRDLITRNGVSGTTLPTSPSSANPLAEFFFFFVLLFFFSIFFLCFVSVVSNRSGRVCRRRIVRSFDGDVLTKKRTSSTATPTRTRVGNSETTLGN